MYPNIPLSSMSETSSNESTGEGKGKTKCEENITDLSMEEEEYMTKGGSASLDYGELPKETKGIALVQFIHPLYIPSNPILLTYT